MKTVLHLVLFLLIAAAESSSQITSPVPRANFGVDGDLRANFFNGAIAASGDDWFAQPGTGTGQGIIDTTGAAAMVARYTTNMASRRLPFYRTMRYPGFTVINNRLLLDAVFTRDYHGDDSTVFASGGNKNGDNPMDWQCPVSQGIPDKNDILDMMVHVRRAGPNVTDSLWMFGGLSLDNTTGNRYFDFEMYQTDIYYDRGARRFYGYGPDAGHTSWEFDAAGNITKPGDIIFSAEYQSSSLTFIEARIWVNRSALSTTPTSFNWSGKFDGGSSGATYGYASIQPKTAGAYYTGLQCGNNTWGGPFGVILQDESLLTDYDAKQFVEFSVNLTKLGLDPVTLLGGSACGMPFRRVLVKTRASASFSAELKDFVGPFDFFMAPKVNALTSTPNICNSGSVAEIHVTNPLATSVYQWTTLDGNIISSSTGSSIYVDRPGSYIVTQYLQAGCSAYALDTIQVSAFPICEVLAADITDLRGILIDNGVQLNWKLLTNEPINYFEIQRSIDGVRFETIGRVDKNESQSASMQYAYQDRTVFPGGGPVYYRIKIISAGKAGKYSRSIAILRTTDTREKITIYPNPVKDVMQVQVDAGSNSKLRIDIFDAAGKRIISSNSVVQRGNNILSIDGLAQHPRGVYLVLLHLAGQTFSKKIILTK